MTLIELSALLKECGVDREISIEPKHRLREDLLLTSFSIMLFMLRIEEKYRCSLEPTRFLGIETVDALLNMLNSVLDEKLDLH